MFGEKGGKDEKVTSKMGKTATTAEEQIASE